MLADSPRVVPVESDEKAFTSDLIERLGELRLAFEDCSALLVARRDRIKEPGRFYFNAGEHQFVCEIEEHFAAFEFSAWALEMRALLRSRVEELDASEEAQYQEFDGPTPVWPEYKIDTPTKRALTVEGAYLVRAAHPDYPKCQVAIPFAPDEGPLGSTAIEPSRDFLHAMERALHTAASFRGSQPKLYAIREKRMREELI